MTSAQDRPSRGRPVSTTHAEIEQAAFELFEERGFDRTTLGDIAERVGVGRRTLFRYYQSKNDIPWGQFDETLEHFRQLLLEQPHDLPLHRAVHRAVVEFNRFPADSRPPHRQRMQLILTTPELEAHSVLRHAEWRQVIAEYVAARTGQPVSGPIPQVAGHVSLALALAAYAGWLEAPDRPLTELVEESLGSLADYLALPGGG